MPTISSFFGIAIRMYFDDHAPPHFHAYYANEVVVVDIHPLSGVAMAAGRSPNDRGSVFIFRSRFMGGTVSPILAFFPRRAGRRSGDLDGDAS